MMESMVGTQQLEDRVKFLEAAVGALIERLTRVGVEGSGPSIIACEALGLSNMMEMGELWTRKNAATVLRSYASQGADAEGWIGDPR